MFAVIITHGSNGNPREHSGNHNSEVVAAVSYCNREVARQAANLINEESDFLTANLVELADCNGMRVSHPKPGLFVFTGSDGTATAVKDA